MSERAASGNVLVRGVLWLLTGSGSIAAVSLIVSALLARLLPGDAFGTAVLLLSSVAVLQLFSELGLAVAIVQRRELDAVTRDNVFYLSLLFSVVLAAILVITGDRATALFDAPDLHTSVPFIAVLLVLRTVYSVYRSIMLRDLGFGRIAAFEVAGHVAYAVAAVTLAASGVGPNSVLIGQIGSSLLLLGAVVVTTRIVPRSRMSLTAMRGVLGFGFWVAANRVLSRAAGHLDKFVIAAVVSPASVGMYFIAQQLVSALPNLVNGSVNQVTLLAYARIQDDPRQLEEQYWRSLRYVLLAVYPSVALIASHAEWLIALVFGADWSSAVILLQILSIAVLVATAGESLFATVLYAAGRSREVMLSSVFRVVMLPLSILIGARYGVEGVAWASAAYAAAASIVNVTILRWVLGFSPRRLAAEITRPSLLAGATLIVAFAPMHTPLAIVAVGAVQVTVIAVLIRLTYPDVFAAVLARIAALRGWRERGAES